MHLGGRRAVDAQEMIEMGSRYFRRNMVVTNGTIRIPDWPHVNFKVSVDGIEARHNSLRGAKTYQRIKRTSAMRLNADCASGSQPS